ncbi:MAG: hypothetical protein KAG26_01005 [Methylococcales bacterium]|nr:hypothetical protein [Methylococcales bacterium]
MSEEAVKKSEKPAKPKAPAPVKKTKKVPMKLYTLLKYIGFVILALWLILQGLGDVLKIGFLKDHKILPIINMVGGAFLILGLIKRQLSDISILLFGAWSKHIGLFILSVWLILQGLGNTLKFDFPDYDKILPILNIVGGIFLILCIIKQQKGNIGLLLLGVWSLLQSSSFLFHISFNHSNTIIHVLGIIAGVLLILKI